MSDDDRFLHSLSVAPAKIAEPTPHFDRNRWEAEHDWLWRQYQRERRIRAKAEYACMFLGGGLIGALFLIFNR